MIAHSRHGTHSPFVYALAENVIYSSSEKGERKIRKKDRLIGKIADYFGVVYTSSPQNTGNAKALYVQDFTVSVAGIATLQKQFRYIVLTDIYRNKSDRKRWRTICQDERFIVTIDLFFFGLLFYRPKQPKQNFRLRYPFWRR
ncbi:hypothetical protein [Sphingobacterium sp. SGG-5]|uniref:hypothetical protein n=1 Tax=Sphingobacterium sp. SGG-5 TaxID=2710881 RepID=UPI0019D21FBE|nr:hypothetical protein [Sphingobacterium sp. SGG-5]